MNIYTLDNNLFILSTKCICLHILALKIFLTGFDSKNSKHFPCSVVYSIEYI